MTQEEKALSLQIQAYLTTASDELYAPGKPLCTEEHHKGIHECMKMWQKLHQYYFSTKQEQPKVDFKIEERKWVHNAVDNIFPEDGDFISEVDFRKNPQRYSSLLLRTWTM